MENRIEFDMKAFLSRVFPDSGNGDAYDLIIYANATEKHSLLEEKISKEIARSKKKAMKKELKNNSLLLFVQQLENDKN